MQFRECWLKKWLVRSLDAIGYAEATPIQSKVLKLALKWHNIVGQSQTGTWKTAAFLLPVLNQINTNDKSLQALIIAPTRELAVQIGDEIKKLTSFYWVTYACLYGWASPNVQKKNLKKRPAIVVATPGRLMDFINQQVIDIRTVRYFILDEVDRMLDMWFVRDITKIWKKLKQVKQTFTFSATMNEDMKAVIQNHIADYKFIKIGEEVTVDKIDHTIMLIPHEHKLYNVIKLLRDHKWIKTIIFTHTKRNTDTLHKILQWEWFKAGMLNGDMSQGKRQWTLNEFRQGKIQTLVTTDVAARWLNMDNVWLVINFEVPIDPKSYIHRIGRTWRAGASWKALMLVSHPEQALLKEIEKIHNIRIKEADYEIVHDEHAEFANIRLNRSTDKPGGNRNNQRKWWWGWRWKGKWGTRRSWKYQAKWGRSKQGNRWNAKKKKRSNADSSRSNWSRSWDRRSQKRR